MEQSDPPTSGAFAEELTDLLCEFLEVAIHLLLRIRNVYPEEIFESRRHFNVSVPWIRHPELLEYVHSTVKSLHSWIQQGQVKKVEVLFMDSKRTPVERFVFQVDVNQTVAQPPPINDVEYALRSFFIKLSMLKRVLDPLPPDCSFEIIVYSTMIPGDADGTGQHWVSADAELSKQPVQVTPIRSVCSEPLSIQLYMGYSAATERLSAVPKDLSEAGP